MKEAGLDRELAMQVITNIMKGTVANLEKTLSPEQSLTGPIKRGDISTIMKHRASLSNAEQKDLYAALGRATLALTDHSGLKKEKIAKAFFDCEDGLN